MSCKGASAVLFQAPQGRQRLAGAPANPGGLSWMMADAHVWRTDATLAIVPAILRALVRSASVASASANINVGPHHAEAIAELTGCDCHSCITTMPAGRCAAGSP